MNSYVRPLTYLQPITYTNFPPVFLDYDVWILDLTTFDFGSCIVYAVYGAAG